MEGELDVSVLAVGNGRVDRDIIPAAVMDERGGLLTVWDRMACVPDLKIGFPDSLSDRRPDNHPKRGRPLANG